MPIGPKGMPVEQAPTSALTAHAPLRAAFEVGFRAVALSLDTRRLPQLWLLSRNSAFFNCNNSCSTSWRV